MNTTTHKKIEYFFTSDTHFGHYNIIKYSNRPFSSVEAMDQGLIDRWNAKVPKDAVVFHLGDFALIRNTKLFGGAEKYRDKLNGDIRFIIGNHDHDAEDMQQRSKKTGKHAFLSYEDVRMENVNGQLIWMSHYAHRVWPKSHRGAWHLYGHSHGTLPDDPNSLSFDCGVDCHNWAPLSFAEVKAIMDKKTFKPVDHHGK